MAGEARANKIAKVDPGSVHEHALPQAGTRPRRLAITSDDVI